MSVVIKQSNLVAGACGVAALLLAMLIADTATAIHRRGRIAHGSVAGYDVVAYDRSCAVAPGSGYNPVGFGFGGYNYGGYPLYGYNQYLPAAYDGFGAVGYMPTMAVGLPGGYGGGGYTANLAIGTAPTPYEAAYGPAEGLATPYAESPALTPRQYRRYMRHFCGAMAQLNWVFLPTPVPLLDCYEGLLEDEAMQQEGLEESIEGIDGIESSPAEEIRPQIEFKLQAPVNDLPQASADRSPAEEASELSRSELGIDNLEPGVLAVPADNHEGPSLITTSEREL